MIPAVKDDSVNLPAELYGFRVEVLAFPLEDGAPTGAVPDPDAFYDVIKLDFQA